MWTQRVQQVNGTDVIVWIPEVGWRLSKVTVQDDWVRVQPNDAPGQAIVMHMTQLVLRVG